MRPVWEFGPTCNTPSRVKFRCAVPRQEHFEAWWVELQPAAQDGVRLMFPFNLFGARSVPTSRAPLRWGGDSRKSTDGDIGMDRFASPPVAAPAEISAAGLTTSDLSQ
jgi:hypothetical protein